MPCVLGMGDPLSTCDLSGHGHEFRHKIKPAISSVHTISEEKKIKIQNTKNIQISLLTENTKNMNLDVGAIQPGIPTTRIAEQPTPDQRRPDEIRRLILGRISPRLRQDSKGGVILSL